jgi:outer membrane protein OmpA-like peptidoglycan-associated protein
MNHSFLTDPEGPDYADVAERLRANAGQSAASRRQPRRRIAAIASVGAVTLLVGGLVIVNRGGASNGNGSAEQPAESSPAEALLSDPGNTTSAAPLETTAPPAPSEVPATELPVESTVAPPVAPTEAPTTVPAPTTSPEPAPPSSDQVIDEAATALPVRYAVYAGGKLYLRGSVPSQAVADEIATRAVSVIGPDNVFVEYVIDPAAPLPDNAPIYVADTVLFGAGSTAIKPEFYGLLDLGATLLTLYPNVKITIEGHTDSRGEDLYNYDLSKQRVDQIMGYLASKGADLSRVEAVPKGESEPIADNATSAGQQANRRIEFTIFDLLS